MVLRREAAVPRALADGAAFQKRFMTLPFEVPAPGFKKTAGTLEGDEGVRIQRRRAWPSSSPSAGGTVTFGGQTHPADGNAAIVVTTRERARELSTDPNIAVRLHGFGRPAPSWPTCRRPPCRRRNARWPRPASDRPDGRHQDPQPVRGQRPAVRAPDRRRLAAMNNYGCSLVWGHPQAPMGTRSIIELIEELALRGGGYGLFTGCAAGDTAMAVVLEVADA